MTVGIGNMLTTGIKATNFSLPIYGSLSIGCRIRFSEDFYLHICHDEHLRIQWRQRGMEVL